MAKLSDASVREKLLERWVAEKVQCAAVKLVPIASDAGFRRYFRFQNPSQWLAVDAPPETEDTKQFVALARYLSANGVSTPTIKEADEAAGLLLVEDFGDELLYRNLTPEVADSLYKQAFDTLIRLQACPDNEALIPRYDQAMLHRELMIFSEWFVAQLLGHSLDENETEMLMQMFELLESTALSQPQTLVHRDFHSRNLIVNAQKPALGVIDFQGALWGACTYDVVSLLRDCYLRWPAGRVKTWALKYRQQAITAGLLKESVSEIEYLRWFDWVGLQRHIKVLGIFARLHLRDGKAHYLQDLPLVIRYTLEVTEAYPQLKAFSDWFRRVLLPRAKQQAWYNDFSKAGGDL